MDLEPVDTATFDLTNPSTFVTNDPRPFWAEVRSSSPVYWHESRGALPGFWVISRYSDIVGAYRDAARLSSARGTVLDVLLHGDDSAGGRMLAVTDGAHHRSLRSLMMQAFSPHVLTDVSQQVHLRADQLIQRVTQTGRFDFAAEVAEEIPMGTICDLLSIPASDRPNLLRWSKSALSSDVSNSDPYLALEARNELLFYLTDLAIYRRANPSRDVISMIASASIDGEMLTIEDVALNCYSLILGGDESSRVSAICAVKAFADHPDQWREFRDGNVSIDVAVEEILRWATPAMHFARTATTDLMLGDRFVHSGDIVTLWNISANFDEEEFDEPHRFQVGRSKNRHVSFGMGRHFCLGAYLGRTELHALLTALRGVVRDITIGGSPVPIHSNFLNGYSKLPVEFTVR